MSHFRSFDVRSGKNMDVSTKVCLMFALTEHVKLIKSYFYMQILSWIVVIAEVIMNRLSFLFSDMYSKD